MFNQPPSMPPINNGPAPVPTTKQASATQYKKPQTNSDLIKIAIIVLLTLLLIVAGLLAFNFYNDYKAASANVDAQVETAVLNLEQEITDRLETDFAEREKNPYSTLTGPSDYGSVSFKYPKTWSVYVAHDASKGGDYEAYLHPAEVPEITREAKLALRVTITSEQFENVANHYTNLISNGSLSTSVISIGAVNANRYDGQIDNNIVGSVVIFKIRDKTVKLQTDAEIYRADFNQFLETITYNQ